MEADTFLVLGVPIVVLIWIFLILGLSLVNVVIINLLSDSVKDLVDFINEINEKRRRG